MAKKKGNYKYMGTNAQYYALGLLGGISAGQLTEGAELLLAQMKAKDPVKIAPVVTAAATALASIVTRPDTWVSPIAFGAAIRTGSEAFETNFPELNLFGRGAGSSASQPAPGTTIKPPDASVVPTNGVPTIGNVPMIGMYNGG